MSGSRKSRKTRSDAHAGVQEFTLDELQPLLNPSLNVNLPFEVQTISQDGRRVYSKSHQAAPASPVKRRLAGMSRPGPSHSNSNSERDVGFDFDVDVENMGGATWVVEETRAPKLRKRRYLSSVCVFAGFDASMDPDDCNLGPATRPVEHAQG